MTAAPAPGPVPAAVPEWMHAPRWTVSHLVHPHRADTFRDVDYRATACGRRVAEERLELEPAGIDTITRCETCRRRAASLGADEDV